MKRLLPLLMVASSASASVFGVGEVGVVEDTSGTIHQDVDLNSFMFGLLSSWHLHALRVVAPAGPFEVE